MIDINSINHELCFIPWAIFPIYLMFESNYVILLAWTIITFFDSLLRIIIGLHKESKGEKIRLSIPRLILNHVYAAVLAILAVVSIHIISQIFVRACDLDSTRGSSFCELYAGFFNLVFQDDSPVPIFLLKYIILYPPRFYHVLVAYNLFAIAPVDISTFTKKDYFGDWEGVVDSIDFDWKI